MFGTSFDVGKVTVTILTLDTAFPDALYNSAATY